MGYIADDYEAIADGLDENGLDDPGRSLRQQQKHASSIDRELVYEGVKHIITVNTDKGSIQVNNEDDWLDENGALSVKVGKSYSLKSALLRIRIEEYRGATGDYPTSALIEIWRRNPGL